MPNHVATLCGGMPLSREAGSRSDLVGSLRLRRPVPFEEVIDGALHLGYDLPIPEPFIPGVLNGGIEQVILVTRIPMPNHCSCRQRGPLVQRQRPRAPNPSTPHNCSAGDSFRGDFVAQVGVLGSEGEEPANGLGELVAIYDLLHLARLRPSFALPSSLLLGCSGLGPTRSDFTAHIMSYVRPGAGPRLPRGTRPHQAKPRGGQRAISQDAIVSACVRTCNGSSPEGSV